MTNDVYDLTIIGAGPTGLFGAFYAGLRGMRVKVVEALPEPGGQLAVLYPEKYIYDVAGIPSVIARDLVDRLLEQNKMFEPDYVYDARIETLTRERAGDEEVWRLGETGRDHLSRAVLISAGIGAFAPNTLDCPGVAEFEGCGVHYYVKEKRFFEGKRVLIVGGGDTAVDWALGLRDQTPDITLIHRRSEFRAHESSVQALMASDTCVMTPWELKEVCGNGHVDSATVFDNRSGEERRLEVDIVLLSLGFKAALGPIEEWGLEMAGKRHIRVDGFQQTNLPGIFAAGDIAAVDGSEPLNLIVTGFAQAAIAANAAKRYVDPKSRLFPGHSSEMSPVG